MYQYKALLSVTLLIVCLLALSILHVPSSVLCASSSSSSSNGTVREWLSDLNDQAANLQSSASRLQKAIAILSMANNTASIISMRSAQLKKINYALDMINQEISIFKTTCSNNDGPDCTIPICVSKCLNCTAPGICSQCYGNWNGTDCSYCKMGWKGIDCNTSQCDSKCLICTGPSQCSVCSGNWDGANCTTCKAGWAGTNCATQVPVGDLSSSSILTPVNATRFVSEIVNSVRSKPITLLYRSSRDSYNPSIFHSLCDNKGPTITIVKANTGAIFGGYTSISWNSGGVNFIVTQMLSYLVLFLQQESKDLQRYSNNHHTPIVFIHLTTISLYLVPGMIFILAQVIAALPLPHTYINPELISLVSQMLIVILGFFQISRFTRCKQI
ncbi:predicted protein [Naegleria gruberi]|uniref:Predicted protein n=1 Tax=Naegleria gruberi TaxID=5762 RepID=D2VCC4_NAEGR|nr:uncharacterized protein NAEGRDRAFT_66521 [Naegleria gruberi]EFC45628.1 predicted protein [Naegleria gruberi]|eukprot:XP_002678372.1 predicted protein [Naegleria gruberi strain NEG-M]